MCRPARNWRRLQEYKSGIARKGKYRLLRLLFFRLPIGNTALAMRTDDAFLFPVARGDDKVPVALGAFPFEAEHGQDGTVKRQHFLSFVRAG